jgi:hypothetical protein
LWSNNDEIIFVGLGNEIERSFERELDEKNVIKICYKCEAMVNGGE